MNIIIDLGILASFIVSAMVVVAQIIRSLFAININNAKGKNKTWMTIIRVASAILIGIGIYYLAPYGLADTSQFLEYPLWAILLVAIPIGIFGKKAEDIFIKIGKITISAKLSTSVTEVANRKK